IAGNVANMNTTRNEKGELAPYRRRFVLFAAGRPGEQGNRPGVHVMQVAHDQSPFRRVFDPGNRDAGSDGYVQYPNVDLAIEQVASKAVADLATGKTEDVTGVMTAMEKSDVAFKTLLSIRSKLMEAYEEIKSMPI